MALKVAEAFFFNISSSGSIFWCGFGDGSREGIDRGLFRMISLERVHYKKTAAY